MKRLRKQRCHGTSKSKKKLIVESQKNKENKDTNKLNMKSDVILLLLWKIKTCDGGDIRQSNLLTKEESLHKIGHQRPS